MEVTVVHTSMRIPVGQVKTDRFRMEYFKFGTGKRPLVILPGLSVQSVLIYASAIVKDYGIFAEGFTVYVFDRAADVPRHYPISEMARDTY